MKTSKVEWTLLKDEKPEDGQDVFLTCLTTKGARRVNKAYYDAKRDEFVGSGSMARPIAWAPLPEPYDGEE